MKLGIFKSKSCSDCKEVYKKVCCTCKIVFWLFNSLLLWLSRCRRRRRILRSLVWTATTRLGDKSRSHRASSTVGREGLVHSIPVLTREYLLPPQWVPRPPSVPIYGVHTAPKYGTKPIRYVTLHFRDRRSTALVRPRNRDEMNICFLCLNKSPIGFYGHDFRCRSKAIQHNANSLKLTWPHVVARHTHVVNTVDIFKIFVTFIPSHRDIARSGLSARSVRMERNEERLLSLSPFVDVWLATEVKEICKIVTVIININSWRPLVSSLGWA